MKNILVITILFFLSGNVFSQTQAYKKMLKEYYNDFPTITLSAALEHLKKSDAHFLDIREKSEFEVSHIRTATRMNPDSEDISKLKSIPKNDLIIVYCSVGARSQTYGEMLKKKGYTNVVNLYGGLFNWANHKFPMVDSNGKSTIKIHGYNKEWGKWVTNGEVVY